MQVYSETIVVTENDIDELQHVNNVRYVQWVNDIAKAHWHKNASTSILKNYFWILLSHTIDYKASAVLNETLLITTYVTEAKGVKSTRIVEIFNKKSNTLLAKSTTNWCFMSTSSKKPTRITQEITDLFT